MNHGLKIFIFQSTQASKGDYAESVLGHSELAACGGPSKLHPGFSSAFRNKRGVFLN